MPQQELTERKEGRMEGNKEGRDVRRKKEFRTVGGREGGDQQDSYLTQGLILGS